MKVLNFTIIKLTLCLIIGIVIGYYFNISLFVSFLSSTIFIVTLLILLQRSKKQFSKTVGFGVIAYFTMICIGTLTVALHNPKNIPNHYSNIIDTSNDSLYTTAFRIREVLKPGRFHDKYVIDILDIEGFTVKGKSLLNVKIDSSEAPLKVDAVFISTMKFKELLPPLNPGQFDYKKYLEKKYIYHQVFSNHSLLLNTNNKSTTLLGIADNIRQNINSKLKPYNFKPDEIAIINALLLGQRQDISEEVYTSYTNAGAIHILAVSGLHVGIILMLLNTILKPIEFFKRGRLIKTFLLITALWSFAVIAGLSASVTRAVTMFSIVAIGLNLNRPTNIFNTLAVSMLAILLCKPLFIFDVGFQLSYMAVFAIVTIDPILFPLWKPKKKVLSIYWHTLTITLAAQFGIIPLSLYYFHKFPSLFFVSNLVIIPFLGVILGLGILIIVLATINLLPQILAKVYGTIISYMNDFIAWIADQESFLFKDIAFSLLYVICAYLLMIALFKTLKKPTYKNIRLLLAVIIIVQCASIYLEYQKPNNQLIVFHKSRHSLISKITNNKIIVANDFDSLTQISNNIIKDYRIQHHIETIKEASLKSIYNLNTKTLFIIDSLGAYQLKSFTPDYILLRQSPKINLNRLIDSIQPKYIIADGSNYKSYVNYWQKVCKKRKLPFHATSKKGAFILNY